MKLGEAVLLRADLLKKIEQIQHRIKPNLVVEESKEPQEDPVKMLAQLRNATQEYTALVIKITKTNYTTKVEKFDNVMNAIARKESMQLLLSRLKTIRQGSQITSSYDEPRATLNINNLQSEIDKLEIDLREINSVIQEINWTTELEE